jgi:hypothetical protein
MSKVGRTGFLKWRVRGWVSEEVAMPYKKRAADILAEWRAAERRLLKARSSAERQVIRAEIDALRDAYQRVLEEAHAASAPAPPPLPTEP